jgi:hypothetical protein
MAWTTEQERTISWQVGLYLTILIVNLSNTTMIVLAVRHLSQESPGITGGERYRYSNSRQQCCETGPFLSYQYNAKFATKTPTILFIIIFVMFKEHFDVFMSRQR